MTTAKIGLDNPIFTGRLRTFDEANYRQRPILPVRPRTISEVTNRRDYSKSADVVPRHPGVSEASGSQAVQKTYGSFNRALENAPSQFRASNLFANKVFLSVIIGLLLVTGTSVAYMGMRSNQKVEAQVVNLQEKVETVEKDEAVAADVPSETPPDNSARATYTVAPDLPRMIKIPKINVNARVLRVGVDGQNAIKAPSNIYDTGWYDGSAKPGEKGASLIDGHVHGIKSPGVFYNLKKLVPGDVIVIERGDGSLLNYKVVKSQVYKAAEVDMAAALASAEKDKNGLNLITCAGKINDKNEYQDRLVIFAVQE